MIHIRELTIDGVGCLRSAQAPWRFDSRKITLFLDDNESGKTTLQMALLASLYGLETSKARASKPDCLPPHRDHWAPLAGPPFGTRLHLHDGQRLLEIRWDFAREGDLHVVDLDAGRDVTAELCPRANGLDLGHRLLGLTIDEFAKTCLVRQDDLARVRDPAGLNILVQRVADSKSSDTTVGQAIEKLSAPLRSYPGVMLKDAGRVENEIRRLEESTADIRRRLDELEAERSRVAQADAEIQQAARRRNQRPAELAKLEYLAQWAEQQELDEQVDAAQAAQAKLAELRAELDTLEGLDDFPADQAEPLTTWQAERLSLLRRADQKDRDIAERQKHMVEPARHDLEQLAKTASVTQDGVAAIAELLGRARDFEAREQELLGEVAKEEERLAEQGAPPEELDRLEERFADIDAEDVEFLNDLERAEAQARSDTEEAKRLALEANQHIERVLETRERRREAAAHAQRTGLTVAGGGLLVGAVLMAFQVPHLVVGLLVLLAGAGAGAALVFKARRQAVAAETLQDDELASAKEQLAGQERRAEQLAAEQGERARRLKALAHYYRYEQPEVFIEDFRALDDLRDRCVALTYLRKQLHGPTGVARQRETIEADVDRQLGAYDVLRPSGQSLSATLEELQSQMARSLRLQQQIAEGSASIARDREECDRKRQDAEELTARIRAVLEKAGIRKSESVPEGMETFHNRLRDHHRRQRLAGTVIPQAEQQIVEPTVIAELKAHAERLHRAVSMQREERPEVVSLEVAERSQEYRRQFEEKRAELEALGERANDIGRTVVDVLSRYHDQKAELEAQLAERQRQLARARRHKATLELAIGALEDIGNEVHGRWAEELNRSTSDLLELVAPTLEDLKFDTTLHFGVQCRGDGRPVHSSQSGPILSAGTWDQLSFAVRLGLAGFVAKRGPGAPLLLDDPFAHFDDPRFEQALRLLAGLAGTRHQVVLFSCQRERFEWLRSRDPAWFDAHVSSQPVRPAAP